MDMEFIAVGFRFWLAVVLIVAGLSKLGKRREFEEAVIGTGFFQNSLRLP